MCSGYLSQIDFMLGAVQRHTEILETKLVDGEKAPEILEPLVNALDKSMTQYQTGMRTIKGTFVTRLQTY